MPRYEDRLRNEDLAVQAAFQKRKESKKLSQKKKRETIPTIKQTSSLLTQEEAYDFFTKVDWEAEIVSMILSRFSFR